jgi:hypothetical protein
LPIAGSVNKAPKEQDIAAYKSIEAFKNGTRDKYALQPVALSFSAMDASTVVKERLAAALGSR